MWNISKEAKDKFVKSHLIRYANPKELAAIINRVLSKIKITEENEMMVHVYVNHFYKEGILENAND
ncbi:hypothetical protein [Halalkalibacter okhensis]|uniref:Uncharacterized protein n=1 Tax=Halalkalibacter okhensis TaxID=333138 RepID=A0A0B0IPP4_9BACI|nr:hypothetical protein [Halalkalibacter okhensis]KHF41651.1 hypothetical protein LQ50_02830 [Halalkalibacter okhensis]